MDHEVLTLFPQDRKNKYYKIRKKILLTIQSALIGKITDRMNLVLVCWDEKNILIRIFFKESILEEDIILSNEIKKYMKSKISSFDVNCYCLKSDSLNNILRHKNDHSIFRRDPDDF